MSREVVNLSFESNSQFSQSCSSLFDDAYNSISTAFGHVKETIVENPYTSATIGLAATAGLLYLARGKLWGAAAETEGAFLKLSTHGSEARLSLRELSHSPRDPEALLKIRAAAKGDVASKVSHTAELDLTPPTTFDLGRVRTVRVSISKLPSGGDSQSLARIQEAAKGIGTRRFSMDPSGRPIGSFFKKDLFPEKDIKKHAMPGAARLAELEAGMITNRLETPATPGIHGILVRHGIL